MTISSDRTALQLRSLLKENGELELSLVRSPVPVPRADQVLVRVEATPINPSDQGVMFGAADLSTAAQRGTATNPVLTAQVQGARLTSMAGRIGKSLPIGNEGAGVVVEAGESAAAQALLGRTVAVFGGGMYAQYRCIAAEQCIALPVGSTPAEGASSFVNPLTALGMVETMRREGHSALVHTAAASNLGQMLNRICIEDGVDLVNVVRSQAQLDLLKSIGAKFVLDSTSPGFNDELIEALAATGATLAFDATGGGTLAAQILGCMEVAQLRQGGDYSVYGSTRHKQVYIYGRLDPAPLTLNRNFGMAWGVGGWLLMPFLQKIGPAGAAKLRERVVAGLRTTFASRYTKEISLAEALTLEALAAYGKRSTGEKYLINPNKGLPSG